MKIVQVRKVRSFLKVFWRHSIYESPVLRPPPPLPAQRLALRVIGGDVPCQFYCWWVSAALSWTTAVGGTTIGLVGAKIRTPCVYFCTMAWSCRSSFFGSPSSSSFPLYSQCKCLDLFPDKSTHMFRISIHSWGIDISVICERIIEHTFPVFRFITFTDQFPLPVGR